MRRATVSGGAALGVALLMFVAAGCGGRVAPFRYYVLAPVAGPAPAGGDSRPVSIGVGPVRLPGYLDRPQIVTRRGAEEIDLAELDRWGEALADGVPRTIAETIGALMPNERIAFFPWTGTVQYQVLIDVNRFDGPLGGDVVLEARWRIVGPDRKDLVERRLAVREASGAATYPALVAAMSRALGALSREIVAGLRTVSTTSPTPSSKGA